MVPGTSCATWSGSASPAPWAVKLNEDIEDRLSEPCRERTLHVGLHRAQRDDRHVPNPQQTRRLAKPKITAEMRANARPKPNRWLYVIDEAFDPNGPVPSWAVVGA